MAGISRTARLCTAQAHGLRCELKLSACRIKKFHVEGWATWNFFYFCIKECNMHISDIIGTIAAIAMVFGYLPQTVRTIRTRSTDDIAMGTFLMMGLGSAAFAVQGILTHNIPLFATNLLTTTMSAIIFGIKIYNDYFKKR